MKYIRTKDGIYVVVREKLKELVVRKRDIDFEPNFTILKKYIIAQADTIEELCDVFIKKSNEPGNPYFNIGISANVVFDKKYEEFKTEFEHYDYYGAIWTDKGLIYVAKMNEKGELELL